jgi:hypothetical protein
MQRLILLGAMILAGCSSPEPKAKASPVPTATPLITYADECVAEGNTELAREVAARWCADEQKRWTKVVVDDGTPRGEPGFLAEIEPHPNAVPVVKRTKKAVAREQRQMLASVKYSDLDNAGIAIGVPGEKVILTCMRILPHGPVQEHWYGDCD